VAGLDELKWTSSEVHVSFSFFHSFLFFFRKKNKWKKLLLSMFSIVLYMHRFSSAEFIEEK